MYRLHANKAYFEYDTTTKSYYVKKITVKLNPDKNTAATLYSKDITINKLFKDE